jgi:diguanylate cyclase (GGDEF)-like protein
LSSLAIAYRIKLLTRERDEAIVREEIARRLADADPLTALLNRRSFLEKAIGRPGDHVLQIADLDHFKRVNDTLGHDGGDEVLRVFARMLRAVTPAAALVARIGGEEFAILTAAEEAIDSETLLARLRATRMPFDLKVTASIGTCTGPILTERDWKALYRGADGALFEAKSAGRDRARVREAA